MDKKMKVGIVGCGVISDVYIPSIKNNFSILEVVACTDLDKKRLKEISGKYKLKSMTYDQMLSDKDIDMVINLTNPAVHYTLTKQALEAGKHVYSEKTIAVTVKEGKELCDIAKKKKLRLGCAPDTFLGGGIQTARYVIDKGLIGNVLSGVITMSRDYRVFGENIPHLFTHGGSVMFDMSVYYLTAACFLLGNVNRVVAFGSQSEKEHVVMRPDSSNFGKVLDVESKDVVGGVLEFENGQIVTIHFNSGSIVNETIGIKFYGDKGIMTMGDPNTFGGQVSIDKVHIGDCAPTVMPFTHGFTKQSRGIGAAEMAWSIRAKRPHRVDCNMALHVLEIIEGVFKSIDTGKAYKMTNKFEQPNMLPEGFIGEGFWAPNEESALV